MQYSSPLPGRRLCRAFSATILTDLLLSASVMTLALLGGSPAFAAGLQVSSTRISMPAENNAEAVVLYNTGDESIYAQVRLFSWENGADTEGSAPTSDIVASPSLVQIEPGGSQLVRIVRLMEAPVQQQQSYRMLIDELPLQVDEQDAATQVSRSNLVFRFRYSIPVFLDPHASVTLQPVLNARLELREGELMLCISNQGNAHAQLSDIKWLNEQQSSDAINALVAYLLPGEERHWPLPIYFNANSRGAITARINGDTDDTVLLPLSADR